MRSNVLWAALSLGVLASCGADSTASNQTTLDLTPTNYVTITQTPTTTSTTTIPGQPGPEGAVHPEEGSYVIASGDFPSNIARKYKVAFTDLLAINGWTLAGDQVPEFPAVGTTIKIPPGWTDPGTATPSTSGSGTGETTPPTQTTIAAGSACEPGEYTIVEGDYLGKVATKLDTTVEALNAANTSTQGYSAFYPGLVIKAPPKANC